MCPCQAAHLRRTEPCSLHNVSVTITAVRAGSLIVEYSLVIPRPHELVAQTHEVCAAVAIALEDARGSQAFAKLLGQKLSCGNLEAKVEGGHTVQTAQKRREDLGLVVRFSIAAIGDQQDQEHPLAAGAALTAVIKAKLAAAVYTGRLQHAIEKRAIQRGAKSLRTAHVDTGAFHKYAVEDHSLHINPGQCCCTACSAPTCVDSLCTIQRGPFSPPCSTGHTELQVRQESKMPLMMQLQQERLIPFSSLWLATSCPVLCGCLFRLPPASPQSLPCIWLPSSPQTAHGACHPHRQ